ncbi:unnamed protein product, partial [marine sediment metagenome]
SGECVIRSDLVDLLLVDGFGVVKESTNQR